MDKQGRGQQEGRIIYYEPNPADNRSINSEDLSISVGLTTTKRTRTILTASEKNNEITIAGEKSGSDNKEVNFINGSSVGGGRSLTTNYTELNTTLGETLGGDLEGLGIVDIDIAFNTSYAPMIKINFVDVRGGSVFGKRNKSDYGVFFDLPYPIFNLTVKGYYGKAVEYCLHMVKWNGKFNSKSGNFEIQAEFIGFTYALLTDTLLGYMRAITETPTGKVKFLEIKEQYEKTGNGHKIITINDLLTKIGELNDSVSKLKNDDKGVKKLKDVKGIRKELSTIKESIDFLSNSIIEKLTVGDTNPNVLFNDQRGIIAIKEPATEKQEAAKKYVERYYTDLDKKILEIKNVTGVDLGGRDNNELYNILEFTKLSLSDFTAERLEANQGYDTKEANRLSERINGKINVGKPGAKATADTIIWFYDLRGAYNEFNRLDNIYKTKVEEETKKVSDRLEQVSTEILGFKPNIKNLFRIITTHVEILLDSIKTIGIEAENNPYRTDELEHLTSRLNIKRDTSKVKKDKNGKDIPAKIYPFPQYNEIKGDEAKETWLGSVISDVTAVNEVVFVEQLLEALLIIKKDDIDRAYEASKTDSDNIEGSDWFPSHMNEISFDPNVKNSNPYFKLPDNANHEDYVRLLFFRFFSFNANAKKTNKEMFKAQGKLEAYNLLTSLKDNDTVKDALKEFMVGSTSSEKADYLIKGTNSSSIPTPSILTKITHPDPSNMGTYDNDGGAGYIHNDGDYSYIGVNDFVDGHIRDWRYLPIDGGFDGAIFRNSNGTFKDGFELNSIPKLPRVLTSTYNWFTGKSTEGTRTEIIDNSLDIEGNNIRFIDERTYKGGGINPEYGEEIVEKYGETYPPKTSGDILVDQLKEEVGQDKFNQNPYNRSYRLMDYFKGDFRDGKAEGEVYTNSKGIVYMGVEVNWYGLNLAQAYSKRKLNKWMGFESTSQLSGESDRYAIQSDYRDLTADNFEGKNSKRERGGKNASNDADGNADTEAVYKKGAELHRPFFTGFIHDRFGDSAALLGEVIDRDTGKVKNYDKAYFPYCEFTVTDNVDGHGKNNAISLFGSNFYYSQASKESPRNGLPDKSPARALLFLHTFPFFGLSDHGEDKFWNDLGIKQYGLGDYALGLTTSIKSVADIKEKLKYLGHKYTDMFTDQYPLLGILGNTNAFAALPKSLVYFIGGLFWRSKYIKENGDIDPVNWKGLPPGFETIPGPNDLFHYYTGTAGNISRNVDTTASSMNFSLIPSEENDENNLYKPVSPILQFLPSRTKQLFIDKFLEFDGSNEWETIKDGLEIFDPQEKIDGELMGWEERYKAISGSVITDKFETNANNSTLRNHQLMAYTGEILKEDVYKYFPKLRPKNLEKPNTNYIYLGPLFYYENRTKPFGVVTRQNGIPVGVDVTNNYHLHMRPETEVMKAMLRLYGASQIIQNNYNVWYNHKTSTNLKSNIDDMTSYMQNFVEEFDKLTKEKEDEVKKTKDSLKDKIFNTINDDTIKLNIYRTLSSMYNKWIGGSDGSLFSQCGNSEYTKEEALKEHGDEKKPKLINTFRFVDRAFNEIGEDLIINPAAFTNLFTSSLNKSAYHLITDVLSSNNVDFIPLPTFVDFKDLGEVVDMFKPKTYNEVAKDSTNGLSVGPAFICMYVGQGSNNLDVETSTFADDGIYIQPIPSGEEPSVDTFKGVEGVNLLVADGKGSMIKDFQFGSKDTVPIIGVSYAQQNQNFFKDITLDQAEFTETEESLIIIDEIAQQGNTNKKTPIGQNLFNIYQTRSYNTTVTAMGMPLIQPMMYFQLNNMPMFRGLYTILSVKHKITPHHMTTTFTGNRIRAVKTPLLENETLYMNLMGSVDGTSIAGANPHDYDSRGGTQPTNTDPLLEDFIDTPITFNVIDPIDNGNKSTTAIADTTILGFKLQHADEDHVYGVREFTEYLQTVFNDFKSEADKEGSNFNNVVYLNDMAAEKGGDVKGHKSHKRGVDIDLRQITVTKAQRTFPNGDAAKGIADFFEGVESNDDRESFEGYSRKGTRQLINSLIKFSGKEPSKMKDITTNTTQPRFNFNSSTMGLAQYKFTENKKYAGILLNDKEELLSLGEPGTTRGVTLITKYVDNGKLFTKIMDKAKYSDDDDDDVITKFSGADKPIGEYLTEKKGVDGHRWFKVKLNIQIVNSSNKSITEGWVRDDVVAFKSEVKKTETLKTVQFPEIDIIYFNDPVLAKEFPKYISELEGHTNHLHIRVKMPTRIARYNDKNVLISGEAFTQELNSRKFQQ